VDTSGGGVLGGVLAGSPRSFSVFGMTDGQGPDRVGSRADRLILRGYGPLAGLVVVALLVTLLARTIGPHGIRFGGVSD
jgi:hypothetical protein